MITITTTTRPPRCLLPFSHSSHPASCTSYLIRRRLDHRADPGPTRVFAPTPRQPIRNPSSPRVTATPRPANNPSLPSHHNHTPTSFGYYQHASLRTAVSHSPHGIPCLPHHEKAPPVNMGGGRHRDETGKRRYGHCIIRHKLLPEQHPYPPDQSFR